jgi:hypothetical protein
MRLLPMRKGIPKLADDPDIETRLLADKAGIER